MAAADEATTPGEFIPDLDLATKDHLDAIVSELDTRRVDYTRCRDYYEGRQRVRLTARAKKYLMRSGLPYAHNLMERVVDTLVDRLEIASVAVRVTFPKDALPEAPKAGVVLPATAASPPAVDLAADPEKAHEQREADASSIATEWLNTRLADIGFDELSTIVHHEAVTSGDAYPAVTFDHDEGAPCMTYALPDNCVPFYADGDPLELESVAQVTKTTIDHAEWRFVTIYTEDAVTKYAKSAGTWGRWVDTADNNAWPLPWVNADGTPRGVPYGHLRNKNHGRRYGTSEIRLAIPQQDALNKRMIDLDLISDNQGYQQRWATGIENSQTLRNFPGSLWRTANKDARFGFFPPGDLTGVLGAIDTGVQHLAATTATPLHELTTTGTPPSGESKKTADTPLVKKAKNRMMTFGRQWKRLLQMMVQMAIDHGLILIDGIADARIEIDIEWENPEPRNDLEHFQLQLIKQQLGVSQHTTLLEDDYDPDREAEYRAQESTGRTAAMVAAMRAGNDLGGLPA
jgi:hypothetical protein